MRLGVSDIDAKMATEGSDVRKVTDVKFHPKYKRGKIVYDVAIAYSGEEIIFTEYIRQVCLPYLAVDDRFHLSSQPIISTGWKRSTNKGKSTLSLMNSQVYLVLLVYDTISTLVYFYFLSILQPFLWKIIA